MTHPPIDSGRRRRGINLSSHSRTTLPSQENSERTFPLLSGGRSRLCPFPGCTLPVWRRSGVCVNHAGTAEADCTGRDVRDDPRTLYSPPSARELVLSVASWIEAERIDVTERIVFPIARAAGAKFPIAVGRLWLAEPRDRWKGRAKPPRNAHERSRRLLIVAFLAIDRGRGQGRGIVRRSSARCASCRREV